MAHGHLVLRIVATLAAVSLIAACGFKGPLYLPPESEQTPSESPAPPSTVPATTSP